MLGQGLQSASLGLDFLLISDKVIVAMLRVLFDGRKSFAVAFV
jgi:hypothetical protein